MNLQTLSFDSGHLIGDTICKKAHLQISTVDYNYRGIIPSSSTNFQREAQINTKVLGKTPTHMSLPFRKPPASVELRLSRQWKAGTPGCFRSATSAGLGATLG